MDLLQIQIPEHSEAVDSGDLLWGLHVYHFSEASQQSRTSARVWLAHLCWPVCQPGTKAFSKCRLPNHGDRKPQHWPSQHWETLLCVPHEWALHRTVAGSESSMIASDQTRLSSSCCGFTLQTGTEQMWTEGNFDICYEIFQPRFFPDHFGVLAGEEK